MGLPRRDTTTGDVTADHPAVASGDVTELVAVIGNADETLRERIDDIWSAGDAVAILDPNSPEPWSERLVSALDPHRVVGRDGSIVERPHARSLGAGDALVVTTSGSMGTPKAAVLTHEALSVAAELSNLRLGTGPADIWLMCLPPWHIGGFSVMTRANWAGSRLITSQPGDREILRRGHEVANRIAVVPAQLDELRIEKWATVLVGGSAAPAQRPATMVTTYGMTETAAGIVYDGIPLDGVEIRLEPLDDAAAATIDVVAWDATAHDAASASRTGPLHGTTPADTPMVGEIAVRSPTLLRTYRHAPAPIVDGWFRTGDLGYHRHDEGLVVLGRRGGAIRTGGETVLAEPLEAVLIRHPAVRDVGVTSRPHARWGREVIAVVALATPLPDARTVLATHAREVLPRWAAPREVVIVESIPRTPGGKLDREALANLVNLVGPAILPTDRG